MSIDWSAFLTVTAAALIAATLLVTLFSLGLRLGDGSAAWRRPLAIAVFALCAILVLGGIWLVVPVLHP